MTLVPSPEDTIDHLYAFVCQPALAVYSVFIQMLKVTVESQYLINNYYSFLFSFTIIV